MSYRMFVPSAKSYKARNADSDREDMSLSFASAKSIKIFVDELPTLSSKSAKPADVLSDTIIESSADEQPYASKGSKSSMELTSKASKTNVFERFLDVGVRYVLFICSAFI